MASGRARPQTFASSGMIAGRCDSSQAAEAADGSGCVVLFDGRLHDRPSLVSALRARPGAADADLVLLAYRQWGRLFADRLVGDYACAIWEPTSRQLLLVRDSLGAVPLCFWRSSDTLIFASEPRGLLAQPDIPTTLDEVWMGRWLALLPADTSRTEYRGIESVRPGHVASHGPEGSTILRHWRPEDLPPLRLANDAAYVERLRDLLDSAVADRMAGARTVASHLSGGLDSTAVTATAARLLAARGRRLTAFTAVPTHVFNSGPGHFGNEGPPRPRPRPRWAMSIM